MDLTVHLIRTNDIDDVIRIRKRMSEGFILRYVDGTLPHTVWINEKNDREIMSYLDSILYFFQNDDCPFVKIQVSVPGHPVMFIKHSNFTDEFCDQLMMTIDNWVHNPPSVFTQ
jgi:hypothetical protein